MIRDRREAGPLIPVVVVALVVPGWWPRGDPPVPFAPTASVPAVVGPTVPLAPGPATGDAAAGGDQDEAAIAALRARDLRLPIDGVEVERLKGMFGQPRGENPAHEAVDILAPRNTPIHAVEDGTIAKLFTSNAGGLTIYQYDPGQRFCYYYAHLARYADGLGDGRQVARGEVIGFVGTSGDAPADTPHLHFAILEVGAERHWWGGRAIDPYLVFK